MTQNVDYCKLAGYRETAMSQGYNSTRVSSEQDHGEPSQVAISCCATVVDLVDDNDV